jgi:hypothetical protein
MATVQSSRTCLPKLCCSIAAIGLFITGILITGAYPHSDRNDHNPNKALYEHLDEALDRINKNLQRNTELADRISRSPRAIRTIQALVTKTVATYMFVRHNNGDKRSHKTTGLASWAEPFFKKKE